MWTYNGICVDDSDIDISEYEGFVYVIRNRNNGKLYIGKKTLISRSRKKVKKKNGKGVKTQIIKKESDWKKYWGSNIYLKEDAEEFKYENIDRQILHFCKSKSEGSYIEAYLQFKFHSLVNSEKWYNRWIKITVNGSTIKNINEEELKKIGIKLALILRIT